VSVWATREKGGQPTPEGVRFDAGGAARSWRLGALAAGSGDLGAAGASARGAYPAVMSPAAYASPTPRRKARAGVHADVSQRLCARRAARRRQNADCRRWRRMGGGVPTDRA